MLSLLKINNVAIIENAEIEFAGGLNVLTGETGAGKSIVLDALGAVLGFRTQKGIIRTGASQASVTAVFTRVSARACEILNNYGIQPEQDESILVSRVISEEKNICRINGEPVTVSVLRELGGALVSIHGQQDNRELLDDAAHLAYIDAFLQQPELPAQMKRQYEQLAQVRGELEELLNRDAHDRNTTQLLEYEINELELAGICPGEEEELKKQREAIRGSEKLLRLLAHCRASLNGDEDCAGALEYIRAAVADLERANSLLEQAGELYGSLNDAMYAVQGVPAEVCGWLRKPSSHNSAISFLMVAEDTLPNIFASALEPTGSPVLIYSSTTAISILNFLSIIRLRWISTLSY